MKKIRFGAVYGAPPLFDPNVPTMGYRELAEFNLSSELIEAISAWDERYQATYCDSYPPDSRFETTIAEAAFKTAGRQLGQRLQEELGDDYQIVLHQSLLEK